MLYCIVGSPLSGKSTLGRMLSDQMECAYVSTGQFARGLGMDINEKSIRLADISDAMNDRILNMVANINQTTVLDGFPRSGDQFRFLQNLGLPYKVVFLFEDPAVSISRILTRQREDDNIERVRDRIEASLNLYQVLREEEEVQTYRLSGDLGVDLENLIVWAEVD